MLTVFILTILFVLLYQMNTRIISTIMGLTVSSMYNSITSFKYHHRITGNGLLLTHCMCRLITMETNILSRLEKAVTNSILRMDWRTSEERWVFKKAWWFILLHSIEIQPFICISCHHWTDKHLAGLTVLPWLTYLPSILPIVWSLLLHPW